MKKIFLTVSTLFLMTSCASVVHGTSQEFKVKSNPNNVVKIINQHGTVVAEGKGQVHTHLKRGAEAFKGSTYTILVNEKSAATIEPTINIGAFGVGNFFVPTFLGYIIDGVNGAMWDLQVNGLTTNFIDLTK